MTDPTHPHRTDLLTDDLSDEEFARLSLRQLPSVEPSAALLRQVAEIPLRDSTSGARSWWPFEHLWAPALGLLAAAALGLVVGAQDNWLGLESSTPTGTVAVLDPATLPVGKEQAADQSDGVAQDGQLGEDPEQGPNSGPAGDLLAELEEDFSSAFGAPMSDDSEWLTLETL